MTNVFTERTVKLYAILNTVENESMSEFQRAMLTVQKRDATYELNHGPTQAQIESLDPELDEFERQFNEAHHLVEQRFMMRQLGMFRIDDGYVSDE